MPYAKHIDRVIPAVEREGTAGSRAMTTRKQWDLERRIVRVAEAALAQRKFVTVIDVLVGLGWLPPAHLDSWRQGRIDCLECTMTVNLNKLSTALRFFRVWARRRGLRPSETAYVARTRDRRRLRATYAVSLGLSPRRR